MIKRKTSAVISLAVCIACALALAVLIFTIPAFANWFFTVLGGRGDEATATVKTIVITFYTCAPFAGVALAMLIKLLLNIINDKVFIMQNVKIFRFVSWCCYAVMLATGVASYFYVPLFVIAFAMGVVGTLLRVTKNIMQSATEIREENDLTI